MLESSEQLAWLCAHPDRIAHAVEEVLRYDLPVTQALRIAPTGTTLAGVAVAAGGSVMPSLLAAGHDPAVHDDPHAFRIDRPDHGHHAFGGGAQFCLGAPLAKAEAQIALAALLARFPVPELADRPRARKLAPAFNGFDSLWVVGCR